MTRSISFHTLGCRLNQAETAAITRSFESRDFDIVAADTDADIVVVRFGDKYRQWNAAFDAGNAAALGKALVTLHDASTNHALKEVDAAALAVCATPEQVVESLSYVINGTLSGRASSLAAE